MGKTGDIVPARPGNLRMVRMMDILSQDGKLFRRRPVPSNRGGFFQTEQLCLASPRDRDSKQERNEEAGQWRLPGRAAKSCEWLPGPLGTFDRRAQPVDGNL
jgi:hypothetical protein